MNWRADFLDDRFCHFFGSNSFRIASFTGQNLAISDHFQGGILLDDVITNLSGIEFALFNRFHGHKSFLHILTNFIIDNLKELENH